MNLNIFSIGVYCGYNKSDKKYDTKNDLTLTKHVLQFFVNLINSLEIVAILASQLIKRI